MDLPHLFDENVVDDLDDRVDPIPGHFQGRIDGESGTHDGNMELMDGCHEAFRAIQVGRMEIPIRGVGVRPSAGRKSYLPGLGRIYRNGPYRWLGGTLRGRARRGQTVRPGGDQLRSGDREVQDGSDEGEKQDHDAPQYLILPGSRPRGLGSAEHVDDGPNVEDEER